MTTEKPKTGAEARALAARLGMTAAPYGKEWLEERIRMIDSALREREAMALEVAAGACENEATNAVLGDGRVSVREASWNGGVHRCVEILRARAKAKREGRG